MVDWKSVLILLCFLLSFLSISYEEHIGRQSKESLNRKLNEFSIELT